jgi:predicted phage tail protein
LLATIKVHSSLKKYFSSDELTADFNTYHDVIPYLRAMHPSFRHYMDMISCGESGESFALVDKNFNVVSQEEFHIIRVHDNDTIYISPVIVGGGGKRGFLILALFAGFAAYGAIAGAQAVAAQSATLGPFASSSAIGAASGSAGAGGGLLSAFSKMPGFAQSMIANLGLSVLTSLFTKKKKNVEVDSTTRQNGAFGNLTNTVESGTPIALHYGYVRVAGQMLSGYIESEDHGKNDIIAVRDKF